MGHILPQWLCKFDIDNYLNYVIPASPVSKLPRPVSRFLGHRDGPAEHVCAPAAWFWSFIGGVGGIALIEAVFKYSPQLQDWHPPIIIGSFGAAAILEYNSIASPLSQPRNLVLSHVLCAVVAVAITKLFALLPPAQFEDLRWVAGALAVGSASAVMSITGTVHPPAGATALLAATTPNVSSMGWRLVPLVLVAALLMLASALIINNIQRQFPVYWWTPMNLQEFRHGKPSGDEEQAEKGQGKQGEQLGSELSLQSSRRDGEMSITAQRVMVPEWMRLQPAEVEFLESLRLRLAAEAEHELKSDAGRSGSHSENSEQDDQEK